VENILQRTKTKHIGLFGTSGTINSKTYPLEFAKTDPDVVVNGCACPMWVPLVENGEYDSPGADYFIEKKVNELMEMDPLIDTIILGCTHYPFLTESIRKVIGDRDVAIIDPSPAIAARVEQLLVRDDLRADNTHTPSYEFLSAADDEYVSKMEQFANRIFDSNYERK
jgi:glutamate racemase